MVKAFSNFRPKILKLGNFGPKFTIFHFLHETSHFEKFTGVNFKYDNNFFKFRHENT